MAYQHHQEQAAFNGLYVVYTALSHDHVAALRSNCYLPQVRGCSLVQVLIIITIFRRGGRINIGGWRHGGKIIMVSLFLLLVAKPHLVLLFINIFFSFLPPSSILFSFRRTVYIILFEHTTLLIFHRRTK